MTEEDIRNATELLRTHRDGAFGGTLQSLSLDFDGLLSSIKDEQLRAETLKFVQSETARKEPMIVTPQPLHTTSDKPNSQQLIAERRAAGMTAEQIKQETDTYELAQENAKLLCLQKKAAANIMAAANIESGADTDDFSMVDGESSGADDEAAPAVDVDHPARRVILQNKRRRRDREVSVGNPFSALASDSDSSEESDSDGGFEKLEEDEDTRAFQTITDTLPTQEERRIIAEDAQAKAEIAARAMTAQANSGRAYDGKEIEEYDLVPR